MQQEVAVNPSQAGSPGRVAVIAARTPAWSSSLHSCQHFQPP